MRSKWWYHPFVKKTKTCVLFTQLLPHYLCTMEFTVYSGVRDYLTDYVNRAKSTARSMVYGIVGTDVVLLFTTM